MPIVEVKIEDLKRLIGRDLDLNEIKHGIFTLKGEIEEVTSEGTIVYEATHDRPDLYSAEGLARALKGLFNIETGLRQYNVREDVKVECVVEDVWYRPYIAMAIVRGVELDDEALRQIMQLQEKLHVTYCRGRRKASIGVYDLDKVKPPFRYMLEDKRKIRFTPLDMQYPMSGEEILRKHEKGLEYGYIIAKYQKYPLLVDSQNRVLSMPPIINSEDTRVTEETKNIVIDVTGTDLNTVLNILNIMVTSIAERGRKAEIIPVVVEYVKDGRKIETPKLEYSSLTLNIDYVNSTLGLNLTVEDVCKLLKMMRHDSEAIDEKTLKVIFAPYRIDILHPIDLVEDVAIAYGYENIEPELPLDHYTQGKISLIERFTRIIREVMCGLGFEEVLNYMLTSVENIVDKMLLNDRSRVIIIENPVSQRYNAVRNWLIPCLLETLSANRGYRLPIRIFEVGEVAWISEDEDNKAHEERHLAAVIADEELTLVDIMVPLRALLRTLDIEAYFKNYKHPSFIKGRCGKIVLKGYDEVVGFFGEIHPQVLQNFNIDVPVVAFEVNIHRLAELYYEHIKARL